MACLYVDDLMYGGTSKDMVTEFKAAMMKEFEMTNLGLMRYFLDIQVKPFLGKIFILQEKYVTDLLKKFNMSECKPVASPMVVNDKLQQNDRVVSVDSKTFRSIVESLIYLINSRFDILFLVRIISRFMENPSRLDKLFFVRYCRILFAATKRILRYLQGTKDHGI
jgi:hypothetical protein